MDTVPFHFDAYGGLGEVQGLARIDEFGLELQFSTKDALFGVLKSGTRCLRIPAEALLSVRFSRGFLWLGPAIELRVRDLSLLDGLPECEQGRVRLSLKWGDRADGRAFAADLERMRAHRRIQQLDRALERLTTPRSEQWSEPPPAPGTESGVAASLPARPPLNH